MYTGADAPGRTRRHAHDEWTITPAAQLEETPT